MTRCENLLADCTLRKEVTQSSRLNQNFTHIVFKTISTAVKLAELCKMILSRHFTVCCHSSSDKDILGGLWRINADSKIGIVTAENEPLKITMAITRASYLKGEKANAAVLVLSLLTQAAGSKSSRSNSSKVISTAARASAIPQPAMVST